MYVQPCSTTLFGVPFLLPTPQGRWDRRLRDIPETDIRGLHYATLRTRGTFGKPMQGLGPRRLGSSSSERPPGVTACQPNHGWEVTIVSKD